MTRITTLLVLVLCSSALAQYPGMGTQPGTITGNGSATIELQPDRLRMQIDVLYRGSGLEAALQGLEKQKAAAKAKLVALGADKGSIRFKSPKISSSQSAEQQEMLEMMQQRLNARRGAAGKKPAKKKAEPVVVSAALTAEWKLEGKPAEVLVKTHELQKTIRKADLAGQKEATALSPEQQELLEESQQEYGGYGREEKSPGEPRFVFVSRVPDERRNKAMAEAFKKAKKQATELAAAAGITPGPLSSLLGSNSSSGGDDDYSSYGYRSRYGSMEKADDEAVGTSYAPIKYVVNVVAGFAIKEKK